MWLLFSNQLFSGNPLNNKRERLESTELRRPRKIHRFRESFLLASALRPIVFRVLAFYALGFRGLRLFARILGLFDKQTTGIYESLTATGIYQSPVAPFWAIVKQVLAPCWTFLGGAK